MKTSESLLSIGKFIAEYSAHLMGAGVHTSRVVRNSKRIGEAFGLDVKLGVFHKNIILTIIPTPLRIKRFKRKTLHHFNSRINRPGSNPKQR